ncbi:MULTISPECIES: hypothetical protein [Bradyrhizobium]|uniref:Uncharacterized protein n=1 Tax=Bradyrhizobium yuanmingense TaxID=108015 RepID=A0A1C3WP66_9BRAD|nr:MULTISPECIES: hypothetical protein [Bradyrhizobium]MCA1386244.1 hypothetical protein [Bradyrhizobium sp. BRP05]MCA1393807.1 hypothetical protein [Bradyrhizobium sp. IC3123]MCA1423294.1 hypothetical protein [Bradyrhizobium sp. BRP23]MCA1472813.1 hypothetical protein [Bradyrhizobium sp. IC3195]MCA1515411.1 hypothetical protein [Bradyrhizobium sp. NBAIM01]
MNSQEFVEAIKRYVKDAAIEDTIAGLKNPPGRSVPLRERACSDWYNGLRPEDADNVNRVIATSVHQALFGLLAVLDGVRTIDDEAGRFELTYVGAKRILLNDQQAIGLHDLLNAPN